MAVDGSQARAVNLAAAQKVRAVIAAEAPEGEHDLKNAIVVTVGKRAMFVRWDKKRAPHGHLVEFGNYLTSPRRHASGKSTGDMPSNPFFARGRNKSRGPVRIILKNGYTRIIDRTAKRG